MELVGAFEDGWDGIHVLNMNTKEVQIFDTHPFYHTHVINTFENETGIVFDVGSFDNIPFSPHVLETDLFVNKTARDINTDGQHVERMHLHLAGPLKGQVTRKRVSPPGRATDFFRINNLKQGLPYCIYYATEWFHDDKAYASIAILKHDLCQDTRTYWVKENVYPSEPFFIPLGNETDEEDHGLLVFTVLNGPRKASDFVILDAKTLEEITVIQLPVHIPFTAHGEFVPQAAREAVKEALAVEHPQLSAAVEATFQI
jgi:carotenoid cleavage dioxygenase-like enzyme